MTRPLPVAAVTGHRPQTLTSGDAEWAQATLPGVLARLRDEYGTTTLLSGMALGVDLWAARAALDAGLTVRAYLPHPNHDSLWRPPDREALAGLLRQVSDVRVVSPEYAGPKTMMLRNRALVADADVLVAVWNGVRSGTAATVRMAEQAGLPVVRADPNTRALSSVGFTHP